MREYIRRGFSKEQLNRECKKLTALLQALRQCHRSLSTVNGGEEKTLALNAIAYAYEQVNIMRQMKGKLTAPVLPAVETIDTELEPFVDVITERKSHPSVLEESLQS